MEKKTFQKPLISVAIALTLATSSTETANAGGFIGDIFRAVGLTDFARTLDGIHRDFKKSLPIYGNLEEKVAGGVHHLVTELGVEVAGPVLEGMIRQGMSDARKGKLSPLPEAVKAKLQSYFSRDLLDQVRWRSGYGAASLQSLALELGGADAITLDKIIVFKDGRDVQNAFLVAHELGHVLQYQSWGISDFAKRYLRNHAGVEAAAERVAKNWQSGKRLAVTRATGGGGGGGSVVSNRLYQML